MGIIGSELNDYISAIQNIENRFSNVRPDPSANMYMPHELLANTDEPALECNRAIFTVNETYFLFLLIYQVKYGKYNKHVSVKLLTVSGKNSNWDAHRLQVQKNIELLTENDAVNKMEIEIATITFRLLDSRYKSEYMAVVDSSANA